MMGDEILIAVFAVATLFMGFYGGYGEGMQEVYKEAIYRGYAQHCPDTGKFAWKGECK